MRMLFILFICLSFSCENTDFAGVDNNASSESKKDNIKTEGGFEYEELTKPELDKGKYKPAIDEEGKRRELNDGRPLFVNEDGDYAVEKDRDINNNDIDFDSKSDDETDANNGLDMSEGELSSRCASEAEEDLQSLNFPPPGACQYGANENLAKDSGAASARNEQIKTITIPDGAKLCSIGLEANGNLKYDDSLTLTFEDYYLASNGYSAATLKAYGLEAENDHFKFDWIKIRGRNYNKDQTHCMEDVECQIPASETSGQFTLDVKRNWFERIDEIDIYSKNEFNIMVIVTGNKQSSDCNHSGVNIDATVKYVMD